MRLLVWLLTKSAQDKEGLELSRRTFELSTVHRKTVLEDCKED